jgi:hypothetical protein
MYEGRPAPITSAELAISTINAIGIVNFPNAFFKYITPLLLFQPGVFIGYKEPADSSHPGLMNFTI